MPVFAPRIPLVTAERHVDYQRLLDHILTRRHVVEKKAGPAARRLAWQIVHQPYTPQASIDQLAGSLAVTLDQTARFGYRETQRELRRLRSGRTVTAAYQIPDAGRHGQISVGGLQAVQRLLRARAHQSAADIYTAARDAAAATIPTVPAPVKVAAAAAQAARTLHNHVLELVGETLNLGRSAAAFTSPEPPQFAMRSEQLDTNTCDPCGELHGLIVEIGSGDYFDLMPPAECLGGGRCRGIYVYGDEPMQMQQAA